MENLVITGNVKIPDLPERITTPIPALDTIAALRARVRAAGDLTFEDAEFRFGIADPRSFSELTLVARHLRLNSSQIITNGNHLSIFCESIGMDGDSRIRSFPESEITARFRQSTTFNGANGAEGDEGGAVSIYVLGAIANPVKISLPGQNGANGADGLKGATGAEGPRGRDARNGDFGTCRRGPGGGGRGGQGGPGGNGGNGGDGGDGGSLLITFVNTSNPQELPVVFEAPAGIGGKPGAGGVGGDGGRGGPGGGNAGNCTPRRDPERNRGPQGPAGSSGTPGKEGEPGNPKRMAVQELKLP